MQRKHKHFGITLLFITTVHRISLDSRPISLSTTHIQKAKPQKLISEKSLCKHKQCNFKIFHFYLLYAENWSQRWRSRVNAPKVHFSAAQLTRDILLSNEPTALTAFNDKPLVRVLLSHSFVMKKTNRLFLGRRDFPRKISSSYWNLELISR